MIAARGASKAIPRKNLVEFCGKPLIAWTIEHALRAQTLDSVWVTSEDEEILEVSASFGACPIRRPSELAGDRTSSEAAWLDAVDQIERQIGEVGLVCALQATSPLREPGDIDRAVHDYSVQGCDCLFSASQLEDFLIWERRPGRELGAINYRPEARGIRQERPEQLVENGSFYLFPPQLLRESGNRLAGKIGISLMPLWKAFEIDDEQSLELCRVLMEGFLLP